MCWLKSVCWRVYFRESRNEKFMLYSLCMVVFSRGGSIYTYFDLAQSTLLFLHVLAFASEVLLNPSRLDAALNHSKHCKTILFGHAMSIH